MAHKKNNTNLTELLLQCMTQPDPMLSMLEWLCTRLMETEVESAAGGREKSALGRKERLSQRLSSTPLGYPDGTMYLMVPKGSSGRLHSVLRHGCKRSEAMLVQVVQEAFVQGVSTRKNGEAGA